MLWTLVLAIVMPIDLGLCDTATGVVPDRINLSEITWSHAVNSWKLLNDALKSDVKMIEADVLIGTHTKGDKDAKVPIMSHDELSSDLSLKECLKAFIKHNDGKVDQAIKGIKLDFKTIDAFTKSVPELEKSVKDVKFPVWLNADIIGGPVDSTTTPVDADQFLQDAAKFPEQTLSLGWTTKWSSSSILGKYSDEHIDNMIAALKKNNVIGSKHPITFAVRAGITANSADTMKRLLKDVPSSTLTIWSSPDDAVNVEELRKLMFAVKLDRVYIDVPKDLLDKLNLGGQGSQEPGQEPAESSAASLAQFGLLNMAVVLLQKMF